MSRIKHRTQTERINDIYNYKFRRNIAYHKYTTEPVDEKAKRVFNTPAYPGLFSKRSDNNDKGSSNR